MTVDLQPIIDKIVQDELVYKHAGVHLEAIGAALIELADLLSLGAAEADRDSVREQIVDILFEQYRGLQGMDYLKQIAEIYILLEDEQIAGAKQVALEGFKLFETLNK